jgi:hypothetical protein
MMHRRRHQWLWTEDHAALEETGRRRRWSAEEKARIVLESLSERPPGLQLSPRGQLRLTAMQSRRLRSPINVIHLKMQNRQELAGELGSCKQRLFIDLRSRKRLSS